MEMCPQISWEKVGKPQPVPQQVACPQACPIFPFVWILNLRWAPRLATLRSVMQVGRRQPGHSLPRNLSASQATKKLPDFL